MAEGIACAVAEVSVQKPSPTGVRRETCRDIRSQTPRPARAATADPLEHAGVVIASSPIWQSGRRHSTASVGRSGTNGTAAAEGAAETPDAGKQPAAAGGRGSAEAGRVHEDAQQHHCDDDERSGRHRGDALMEVKLGSEALTPHESRTGTASQHQHAAGAAVGPERGVRHWRGIITGSADPRECRSMFGVRCSWSSSSNSSVSRGRSGSPRAFGRLTRASRKTMPTTNPSAPELEQGRCRQADVARTQFQWEVALRKPAYAAEDEASPEPIPSSPLAMPAGLGEMPAPTSPAPVGAGVEERPAMPAPMPSASRAIESRQPHGGWPSRCEQTMPSSRRRSGRSQHGGPGDHSLPRQ